MGARRPSSQSSDGWRCPFGKPGHLCAPAHPPGCAGSTTAAVQISVIHNKAPGKGSCGGRTGDRFGPEGAPQNMTLKFSSCKFSSWNPLPALRIAGVIASISLLGSAASAQSTGAQGSIPLGGAPTAAFVAPASGSASSFSASSSSALIVGTPILDAPKLLATASSSSPAAPLLTAGEELPEAPTPQVGPLKPAGDTAHGQPIAPLSSRNIPAGWRAQPLTTRGKIAVGASGLYSLEGIASIVISAGYEQALNGAPNYGSNSAAYGKRVGAAAVRQSSQDVFTDMVFAPLLNEDPRYFVEGSSRNVLHRTLYAITRPLITRSDDGHSTVNGALLLGYASAAALTPAYYPQINRNFHDTASIFGGSIGGAALGFFVNEFADDALGALHLKHNTP